MDAVFWYFGECKLPSLMFFYSRYCHSIILHSCKCSEGFLQGGAVLNTDNTELKISRGKLEESSIAIACYEVGFELVKWAEQFKSLVSAWLGSIFREIQNCWKRKH